MFQTFRLIFIDFLIFLIICTVNISQDSDTINVFSMTLKIQNEWNKGPL